MSARTGEPDITTAEFARILSTLDPHLPISDAFEEDLPQKSGAWWDSQQEHMVRWFSDQDSHGSGRFSRRTPTTSARITYNRLRAPAAFVWMAEALGVETGAVQAAADAARAQPDARRRPGLLRRHLPWSVIAEHAREHER